ncbi:MAG: hypothetical protein L0387_00735 [Acidobacteria bacterium]|nr:hypothetical protein [Acidobacteriota bacterium]MCI0720291.1 hypothetical protein [Acidobacteriota bacterium]
MEKDFRIVVDGNRLPVLDHPGFAVEFVDKDLGHGPEMMGRQQLGKAIAR